MKKKICFIAQFPPPIHGLSKAVDTLYNSPLAQEFEFEKVDITSNKRFPINLWKILKSKGDLFYFTISQTRGGNLRDLIIFKILELQHKKCLIHLHGGYYRQLVDQDLPTWQREANYRAIRKLAGAIVLGDSLRYIFQGMLDDEKIHVVPNGVEAVYLMDDVEFEKKMHLSAQKKVKDVLYLSNFLRAKGYPEVLELAKLEKQRVETGGVQRFRFDFAGKFFERSEEEFFFSYIRENDLSEHVTYHGIVVGDKKKELLAKGDIFVLLSKNEGQPISVLEAMGNGMAAVTTDVGGLPDLVADGENGIVVSSREIVPEQIMAKLEQMADSLEQIQRTNRKKVLDEFTEKKYVQHMKRLF